MGSKWKRVTVADVCISIVDCVNKTAPVVEYPTNYKMIRTPNIRSGKVTLDGCRYVEKEVYETWTRRSKPQKEDVLLTREAPLGEVGIITTDDNIFLGQRIMQYRADKNKIDPYFLLYSFLSPDLQQQFSMHEGSGSVVSHIRVGDCSKFEINIPPLEIQRSIVEILKSLDDHIDVNIKINQTLEQMSQTLFKSWFVDFDPVIDNALDAGNPVPEALQSRAELRQKVRNSADFKPLPADIRALFPAEFEETELGWVPKGWRIESFSEIAQLVKENVKSEDISTDVHYVGLEHLERKHIFITNYGNGSDVSSNKSAFNKGDLLFGKLRPYFHKVAITPFSGICSTDILVFRAKEKYYKSLMAMYAFTDEFVAYANLRSTGTRMPRAEAKDLLKYKIILPNKNILEKFELLLEGYWTKGQLNNNENEQLTALRDTLLPKLISGELSLEDLPDLVTQTEPA
ncbi:restriction endonuclease subunit S [Klebsiella grimontii]|uniref:restriction endonuclease subunit S n=1 Tax=Klebsiella grimontii TaxID=2058152 RepID=UPI00300D0F2A